MSSMHKAVGIKEIAQALDVSIGTVDRALHGRPGINPMTSARVLKMAQNMGYRPNLAARFLKSQKQLHISVHLPARIASFFDALRQGIVEAATAVGPSVHVEFRSYPALCEGDMELFEQALDEKPSGIIIAPGAPAAMKLPIRRAARRNIPVVCVATDAPGTERLCGISACPRTSGTIAGELISRFVHERGKVVFVTGTLSTEDHREKLEGFRAAVRNLNGGLELLDPIEAHDDEGRAFEQTAALLAINHDVRAIYVSTANSLPVVRAIEEAGLGGRVAVIATDLFPALVPLIRSGRVIATIHQRPITQGKNAFQALYQFVVEGKCPLPKIRIAPHIVMNSNLDLFVEAAKQNQSTRAAAGGRSNSE
jgi:LacI family transcriptional regulator